jgi:2-iminoacetate synthase ThiH
LAPGFGADDLDGTVVHEKIYHDAGASSPQERIVAAIRRRIQEAGRIPAPAGNCRPEAPGTIPDSGIVPSPAVAPARRGRK